MVARDLNQPCGRQQQRRRWASSARALPVSVLWVWVKMIGGWLGRPIRMMIGRPHSITWGRAERHGFNGLGPVAGLARSGLAGHLDWAAGCFACVHAHDMGTCNGCPCSSRIRRRRRPPSVVDLFEARSQIARRGGSRVVEILPPAARPADNPLQSQMGPDGPLRRAEGLGRPTLTADAPRRWSVDCWGLLLMNPLVVRRSRRLRVRRVGIGWAAAVVGFRSPGFDHAAAGSLHVP